MKRLLAVALMLTLARSVAAEPTEADKDAARILFTEAKELRDAGKVTAALERFKRAHDLAATPITTVELARTHSMLGHLVEARRLYRSVEALEKKPGESAKSIAARDEAKQLAADLDAKIPTLIVEVSGDDYAPSEVTVDGVTVAVDVPIAVDPGKHLVAARSHKQEVVVAEGEHDRRVTIAAFKPIPGPTPPIVRPIAPMRPAEASTWPGTLRWVGGVTAGVGVVVGATAGVLALSTASGVKDSCGGGVCPPSSHDDLDATRRWATVSTIGFGVAAVGATLLVIGLTSSPGPSKKDVAAPSVVPYASLGGFGFTGRF